MHHGVFGRGTSVSALRSARAAPATLVWQAAPCSKASHHARSVVSPTRETKLSFRDSSACKAAVPSLPHGLAGAGWLPMACHIASSIIIVLATVRNVPQLVRCWRAKSSTGISMASLCTEVSCYACIIAYGFRKGYALSIWGAEMACWSQDSALLAMVAYLRGMRLPVAASVGLVWFAAQAMLFTEFVPMWFLSKFQMFVGLILGLGARVPQILLNFRNGHTGNLAVATFAFNATANIVCLTTATVLTGDIYVMATQVWMFVLNTTIISQILHTHRNAARQEQGVAGAQEVAERLAGLRGAGSRRLALISENGGVGMESLWSQEKVKAIRKQLIARWRALWRPVRSSRRRPGVQTYSLDTEDVGLDEVEGGQRGSMDGMRPRLA